MNKALLLGRAWASPTLVNGVSRDLSIHIHPSIHPSTHPPIHPSILVSRAGPHPPQAKGEGLVKSMHTSHVNCLGSWQKWFSAVCTHVTNTLCQLAHTHTVTDIEHGTFTPQIFAATGGLGRAATVIYRRLASQLADKWKEPYGTVMGWLRCQISFSLTRSTIACLRSSRGSNSQIPHSISLTVGESRIEL